MEYYNTIKFNFNEETNMELVLNELKKAFDNESFDNGYAGSPSKRLANALSVNNNIIIAEGDGFFTPEDVITVFTDALTAFANNNNKTSFTCKVNSDSTYSDGTFEASYNESTLSIDSLLNPYGYVDYLTCPECGENVVLLSEYDSKETYYCPECGEEIDLSEQYDEYAPIVDKIEIKIN